MCKQSEAQVLNVVKASESTIITLLTEAKLISTAQGQTIETDFEALIADVQNWKSGMPADAAMQVVQDIETALPLLPIPPPYNILVPVALAGLTTILTLLGANSPAPAAIEIDGGGNGDGTGLTPSLEPNPLAPHVQTLYAHSVAAQGEAKVEQLTGYKVSMIDKARAMMGDSGIAAKKYKQAWNETVETNGLPDTLKAA